MKVYTYNDKVLTNSANGKWLKAPDVDPLNPLGLPEYTIRIKMAPGSSAPSISGATVTAVAGQTDVYDVYKANSNWTSLLYYQSNLIEVLGANTSDVTNMASMFGRCSALTSVSLFDTSNVTAMNNMFESCSHLTTVPQFDTSNVTTMKEMFNYCTALTSVPLFNTSNVTDMSSTFNYCNALTSVPQFNTSNVTTMNSTFNSCSSLTSVPLFNTSKVTNMYYTFYGCTNVQSGALALYQQASTQTTIPEQYYYCFKNCGSNTVTGAAELAQIPASWGGTGA